MKLAIEKIAVDDTIYPRTKVSEFHVNRLKLAIEAGARLPPLVVEAKTLRLVDGRHRYEAMKESGHKHVEVEQKVYNAEADLFADAVRLNVAHGETLDSYTIRSAIIRLTEYGFTPERIVEVVRLPAAKIEEIRRGFAFTRDDNKPVALKGGLSHMHGQRLDERQIEVNRHYGGSKAVFYVRQIRDLLESGMWPDQSATFRREMDHLVKLWADARGDDKIAA